MRKIEKEWVVLVFLYKIHGLPASPFRTDNWEGVTDGISFDD